MPGADTANIRNIAIVGHMDAGKTTFGEALLHKAGVTNRMGSVDDGSSMLDSDEESKERKHSCHSTPFYFDHNNVRINFVDTPGTPDFCGESLASLSAVEAAMIVVSATGGVGVNTRRRFNAAGDFGLARMVVVNRIDAEGVELDAVINMIRETFGDHCHPINLPADGCSRVIDVLDKHEGAADVMDVASAHQELVETIVETDDELMTTYMETGEVPHDKLEPAIVKAVQSGHLIPIVFISAAKEVGIDELLEELVTYAPNPQNGKQRLLLEGEGDDQKEIPLKADPSDDFVAQVFKVTTDPKSNIKYAMARIFSGTISGDDSVFLPGDRKGHRVGHVHKLRGDQHEEIDKAIAGQIVGFAKLDAKIGDVLFTSNRNGRIEMPRFPTPMFSLAIEPKSRGDVEKVSGALNRFSEEDPCFEFHRDPDTGELLMSGLGDLHLGLIQDKMKRYFKLEIDTHPPKIPYRETITGTAKNVEYTHKKQSGGAGQFARVVIDLEPLPRGEGYEFEDKIFGGAIDQAFRPSVDKGIQNQLKDGVIAGCQVVDVKVALVDGKTHPVDSKDIAFQIAGKQAFKQAFQKAKPILLEPIVSVEVMTPTEYVGEITRDLAGKRGQILGQDMLPGNQTIVRATIPLAEIATYNNQLKSVTQGQGSFTMEFSHYDVVPPQVQQQIVAAHKPKEEEV